MPANPVCRRSCFLDRHTLKAARDVMSRRVIASSKVWLIVCCVAGGTRLTSAGLLDAWHETIPRGKTLGGIAHGNGKFVAVGGDSELLTSTNAVNWQRGAVPSVRL